MSYRIWCAISGHGFGHLGQVAALMGPLVKRLPGLQRHVVSALPQTVLTRLLDRPFSSETRQQDVGLIQPDPMHVDLKATAQALRSLHGDWDSHLEREKRALAAWAPDLLLADIPYLPIAAAAALGIPTVAIASLSWDAVLSAYFSLEDPEVLGWWHAMRQAYAQTTLAFLPQPAILENTPFPQATLIQPITLPGHPRHKHLRHALGVADTDDRPLILVSLGGIPTKTLPVNALAQENRFHWLLDIPLTHPSKHLHRMDALLSTWSFADLAASVDGIVSKPGYGMAIASAAQQIPFLYSRRGTFPDEPPICAWLDQVGRCMALEPKAFYAGDWYLPLRTLLDRTPPPPPLVNGAEQAAEKIIHHFFRNRD